MTDEEVQQKYRRAFDFLSRKGITELRSYGRAFGVRAPTAKHKGELIGDIIKIAAGLEPKLPQTNKGARVRAKPVTPRRNGGIAAHGSGKSRIIAPIFGRGYFLKSRAGDVYPARKIGHPHGRLVPSVARRGYRKIVTKLFTKEGAKS